MSPEPWPQLPDRFWERIVERENLLVVVDYDATLAQVFAWGERRLPLPRIVDSLSALATRPGVTLALVSRRSIADLLAALVSGRQGELDPIQLVGEHGCERLRPGELQRHSLPPSAAELLQEAAGVASKAGWVENLETRRTSLFLNTHALSPRAAQDLQGHAQRLWSPIAKRGRLLLERGAAGLELRAAGRDKLQATAALLTELSPHARLLYVGCDGTDDDALNQLQAGGFTLRGFPRSFLSTADEALSFCVAIVSWVERLSLALAGRKGLRAPPTPCERPADQAPEGPRIA